MLSKVQQDGVGEVDSVGVREQERRCSAGGIQVEDGYGHDRKLIQLACRNFGIHAIDLRERGLGLEQHQRRREPTGVRTQELFTRGGGGMSLQDAIDEDMVSRPRSNEMLEEEVISSDLQVIVVWGRGC